MRILKVKNDQKSACEAAVKEGVVYLPDCTQCPRHCKKSKVPKDHLQPDLSSAPLTPCEIDVSFVIHHCSVLLVIRLLLPHAMFLHSCH